MAATILMQQPAGDRPAGNPRGTRSVVMARNGAIATSQPLATAAGLRVLQSGGNAIDAAVTAAAVLAVVEPTMNGAGGDLFAIVYDAKTKKVHGLNASGRAPAAATIDEFKKRGLQRIPLRGELSVSVPGVVDGWSELLAKHGTRTLAQALEPAIKYARDGYAVSEIIAGQWKEVETLLARDHRRKGPDGPPDVGGERVPVERHEAVPEVVDRAARVEQIAKDGRDAFYKGAIAKAIAEDMQRRHGLLTARDLRIITRTGSIRLHDIPRLSGPRAAAEHAGDRRARDAQHHRGLRPEGARPQQRGVSAHARRGEAHRLCGSRRLDRRPSTTPKEVVERMLAKDYAAGRRKEIDAAHASAGYKAMSVSGRTTPDGGDHPMAMGDTIYLTAADSDGNVISLIQSLYETFGSGIVAGDTGIVLHDRGSLFSLTPGHPNALVPGKRPFHTLIPAMVLKDGAPWVSFGVMGGDMQAQGHAQVLANLIDFGMNIQEAGEAPRFRHTANGLALESAFTADARAGLTARGHSLVDSKGLGRIPGHHDRSEDARADGRIGSAKRRHGRGMVNREHRELLTVN
jgi:gamma-glutamyltranspeptidase/glutathione hydrolase